VIFDHFALLRWFRDGTGDVVPLCTCAVCQVSFPPTCIPRVNETYPICSPQSQCVCVCVYYQAELLYWRNCVCLSVIGKLKQNNDNEPKQPADLVKFE